MSKTANFGRNILEEVVFQGKNSNGRAEAENLDGYLGGLARLEDVVEVDLAELEGLQVARQQTFVWKMKLVS